MDEMKSVNEDELSEAQKAAMGLPFNIFDPEFTRRAALTQPGIDELNGIPRDRQDERVAKAREVFGSIDDSDGPYVFPPTCLMAGRNLHLGKGVFINFNVTILDAAPVEIGDYTMIAPGCVITTVTHTLSAAERRQHKGVAAPIKIGKDCWLGANVTVFPGMTIGDNVVVGAGAVVNKDIPSNSLALGVPAKVVRALDYDI